MLPAEAQGAPAANADSSGDREDPGLAELSLPSSAVKRLAKIAAPGYRFSSESLAGIQRVAQAYIVFATNGALSQVKSDGVAMNKAKKGQKPQPAKKTLQAEHIMRFLTLEMPQLGTKVASLFPDYVPEEFKPESVQLLEKLHLQLRANSIPTTGLSQAEPPPETQSPPADSKDMATSNSKRPGEPTEHGGGNSKRQKKQAPKTDLVSPPKKQERAKAPPAKPLSLNSFFGAATSRPQEDDVGKVQTEEIPGETQREQDVSTARREVDDSKDVSTARREVEVSEEVSTAQREVDVGKDENDL